MCAHVEETREWAAQLTHKFPNVDYTCFYFFAPHLSLQMQADTHVLTFDIKLGLALAVNVIFFCSVALLNTLL